MAFLALLDANVLVNAAVRDTLLRAAEDNLYRLVLSEQILDETRRALERKLGRAPEQTAYLVAEIRASFEDALVEAYEGLVAAMENDEEDRHVLAAAVRAGAEVIVTFNLSHFPVSACGPYGIEPQHPDEFLLNLWDKDAQAMGRILISQAECLRDWSLQRLLDRLQKDAPKFIAAVYESRIFNHEALP